MMPQTEDLIGFTGLIDHGKDDDDVDGNGGVSYVEGSDVVRFTRTVPNREPNREYQSGQQIKKKHF